MCNSAGCNVKGYSYVMLAPPSKTRTKDSWSAREPRILGQANSLTHSRTTFASSEVNILLQVSAMSVDCEFGEGGVASVTHSTTFNKVNETVFGGVSVSTERPWREDLTPSVASPCDS